MLDEYANYFTALDRAHALNNRNSKFKCSKCQFTFKTSINAMVGHAEDHRDKRYILIGRANSTKDTEVEKFGPIIPEQHYYCNSQLDYKWNGAHLHTIILTGGIRFNKGVISCRYCDDVSINWGKRGDLTAVELADLRTRRIKFLRKHEDICKVADNT